MLVSVVMPAYNVERYVGQAIESVLNQTHQDLELIVVDDGSADGTKAVLEHYQSLDPRVQVIAQANGGVAAARNAGNAVARGEWIAIMDSDDIMEPHRIERQLAFIEKHPGLSIASALVTWIDPEGHVLGKSDSNLTTEEAVRAAYRRDPVIILSHPTCMIRRDMMMSVGGYRTQFRASSDIDLFNRIADAGGRILVQPEHLVRYRIHPSSVTGTTANWDSTLHRWIRQCSENRRKGLPEPSLEEYEEMWRRVPLFRRLDQRRRDIADILYSQATFSYSVGRVAMTAVFVAISSIVDPTNAPPKVWRKYVRPRLFTSQLAGK